MSNKVRSHIINCWHTRCFIYQNLQSLTNEKGNTNTGAEKKHETHDNKTKKNEPLTANETEI